MKCDHHLQREREMKRFTDKVKNNTGKLFLKSLRKSFPKNHTFKKIINLNTVKLSYSSMAILQSLINQHSSN